MRRKIVVDGYEFRLVPGEDGGQPYLWMGNPHASDGNEYLGAILGMKRIRRLRDFLTAMLREHPTEASDAAQAT